MTRRAFGRGLGALAAAQALGACTSRGASAASGDPSLGRLRDYVRSDPPPDFSGVDWGHVSPDPGTAEGTVLTASPAPERRQCLFLWEEGNMPATTASGGGGSDPADFRPTITSVPAAAGAVRAPSCCARAGPSRSAATTPTATRRRSGCPPWATSASSSTTAGSR